MSGIEFDILHFYKLHKMLVWLIHGPHFEKELDCSATIQAQLLRLFTKELLSLFIMELKFLWVGKGSSLTQNKVNEGQLTGALMGVLTSSGHEFPFLKKNWWDEIWILFSLLTQRAPPRVMTP